jgi:hypothetical protein
MVTYVCHHQSNCQSGVLFLVRSDHCGARRPPTLSSALAALITYLTAYSLKLEGRQPKHPNL